MLASRVATTLRVAVPYAQWAAYAIQLGYLGYNLWKLYLRYLVQLREDQRVGRDRRLDEMIELVVRPRRRRTLSRSSSSPALDESNASNSNGDKENTGHSMTTSCTLETFESPQASMTQQIPGTSAMVRETIREEEDEVTIVYDSRQDGSNLQSSSAAFEDSDVLSEIESNTSTTLESTDSNKGIIHDIYANCFICTYPLNDSKKSVATLPFCLHPFHKSCLDGVLKWHPKCPVCDFNIYSPI